jgi:hypothetical protein
MSAKKVKGAVMSDTALAQESTPQPPAATAAPPTGYRISILPAALEISARLATAEELQTLVKILQANAAIWVTATNKDTA